jgi:hypothetical protein
MESLYKSKLLINLDHYIIITTTYFFSLLAIVDLEYKFIYVDVGI